MKNLLPDTIRLRKDKLGFVFPMTDWAEKHMKPLILDHLSSAAFKQANIWNGKLIHSDIESAFKRRDMQKVRHAWPFIQAAMLTNLFKSAANK